MLRKEFPQHWFYKTNDNFTSGLPDLIMCANGHLCGIELKEGTNKATKLQEYIVARIKEAGGYAFICYSVDEVRKCLKEIL